MSDEPGSAVAVTTVEWRLYNPRRQETRTFEQSELTIEGEARLIGLARKFGAVLEDAGYSFGDLGEFFDETKEVDWPKALSLIERVSQFAPDLIADALTVLLGIYPTNEDGTPNGDFEDTRLFLRGAVNIAHLSDIIRVFVSQNEYARLIGPFSATLSEAMDAYAAPRNASGTFDESGAQAIAGTDGSTLLLEPEPSSSTSTDEPSGNGTETASERSKASSEQVSDAPSTSGAI